MSMTCDVIHGLDFTEEEIKKTVAAGGLLSLELEFSRQCNLRCVYCYADAGEPAKDELTVAELKDVVGQAAELGAKKIILLGGGEPLMYEGLREIIEYIDDLGLEQTIFTNGLLMTDELAEFLFKKNVSVVMKHNSFNSRVQDMLAGVEGAYEKIQHAMGSLLAAGYPDKEKQLGIQTIILKQNIEEIPSMWTWAKSRGIIPYFEVLTLQGRAKEHPEIAVTAEEVREVFDKIKDIDMKLSGKEWKAHPTIASFSCKRHLYSCLINSSGYVQPCTGVDLFVGNVKEGRLADILAGSRTIKDLREIREKIEGPCKSCEFAEDCYGCRGNAYQSTGNYLASDPMCWVENSDGAENLAKVVNLSSKAGTRNSKCESS